MDVAVCVFVLLHLSHNVARATAVHIPCATTEVKFIRAALSLRTLTLKSRNIRTVTNRVAQCCYMLQYAMMLTIAREVGDSIREGRLISKLKSGWKNALCSCKWRIIIKYFFTRQIFKKCKGNWRPYQLCTDLKKYMIPFGEACYKIF
jgi:hypothetical protein